MLILKMFAALGFGIVLMAKAIIKKRLEACLPAMYGLTSFALYADSVLPLRRQSHPTAADVFYLLALIGFIYESLHSVVESQKGRKD